MNFLPIFFVSVLFLIAILSSAVTLKVIYYEQNYKGVIKTVALAILFAVLATLIAKFHMTMPLLMFILSLGYSIMLLLIYMNKNRGEL